MKRLFSLREQSGRLVAGIPKAGDPPLHFDNKKEAKAARDFVNTHRLDGIKVCVTYGPDHIRFRD